MDRESCFQLGTLLKAHGLKGEVLVHFDVDFSEEYQDLESVFVEQNQQLIPFFVSGVHLQKGSKALVSLEDVDSVEDVEKVKGCKLWLPLNFLPQLNDDQYYYHEVIGYKVIDKSLGDIGTISGFNEAGPQLIMMVDHNGTEVLVPVSDHTVQGPDKKAKVMNVNLPEGLIDIYLQEE